MFGWVPFSIGDIVYTGIGILVIRWFWKRRSRLLKKPKSVLLEVGATMALVYGFFHLLWGFNYYREPLHERLNIGKDYSTESLIAVTEHLILKANFWHDSLSINDTSKVVVSYSRRELLNRSKSGPNTLSRIIPELALEPLSIKASIYSLPLTVMGFSGYLNPFTGEAQVDYLIPKHRYPTTLLHEMGHQMGYAAENETNFIGCMAAIYHEDAYFKYSGYIYALRHCLNELSVRDPQALEQLAGTVNKGIFARIKIL